VTAVLLELRPAAQPERPELAVDALVASVRKHRTTEAEDVCSTCGWHWPCPAYFQARRSLIAGQVAPALWAR
jgi:hypothetical protein